MAIENMPKDPMLLLSFVNTRMRDDGLTLEELAAQFDVDSDEIISKLAGIDYTYDAASRRFI